MLTRALPRVHRACACRRCLQGCTHALSPSWLRPRTGCMCARIRWPNVYVALTERTKRAFPLPPEHENGAPWFEPVRARVALQWRVAAPVGVHPSSAWGNGQAIEPRVPAPPRRRCARVPKQTWASPGADVGKMWGVHVRIRHIPSELADRVNLRVQRLIQHTPIRKTHQYDMGPGGEPPEQTVR